MSEYATLLSEVKPLQFERKAVSATDLQAMYNAVQSTENALLALKQMLTQLQTPATAEAKKQNTFSLYGVFAPSDVTWQDFQETKHTWLKGIEDI